MSRPATDRLHLFPALEDKVEEIYSLVCIYNEIRQRYCSAGGQTLHDEESDLHLFAATCAVPGGTGEGYLLAYLYIVHTVEMSTEHCS